MCSALWLRKRQFAGEIGKGRIHENTAGNRVKTKYCRKIRNAFLITSPDFTNVQRLLIVITLPDRLHSLIRQLICQFIAGIAGMSAHPNPFDLVRLAGSIQRLP